LPHFCVQLFRVWDLQVWAMDELSYH